MMSLQQIQQKPIPPPDQAMEPINEAGEAACNRTKPFSGRGS